MATSHLFQCTSNSLHGAPVYCVPFFCVQVKMSPGPPVYCILFSVLVKLYVVSVYRFKVSDEDLYRPWFT